MPAHLSQLLCYRERVPFFTYFKNAYYSSAHYSDCILNNHSCKSDDNQPNNNSVDAIHESNRGIHQLCMNSTTIS